MESHRALTTPLAAASQGIAAEGLSDVEAAERLRVDGANELSSEGRDGALALITGVAREPMVLLLGACAAVYLALGDLQDALVLSASVVAVIAISSHQTRKTERALAALRELSSPRARVIRERRELRIPSREVVRGDLLLVAEGDRVTADALLVAAANLQTDESLLTGESLPVAKAAAGDAAVPVAPGGDGSPCVYAGTLAVAGHGVARVYATGAGTELGKIGRTLAMPDTGTTHLARQVRQLVRAFAVASFVVCVTVAVGYAARYGDWTGGLLAGLALAMSMIPEEFPVILTLFLALGAWRMSRRHVLVRRMPAVEALGSITVLCVDKTGTLTENRMAAMMLSADGGRWDLRANANEPLPEQYHRLLEFAVLASQQRAFDPMERAINEAGERCLAGTEHLHRNWQLLREYPLSPELLAISHVWRSVEHTRWIVAAKGAPEAVIDLCHLDDARAATLAHEVAAIADGGLRVLGVAAALIDGPELPAKQHDVPFAFVGLIGLADPLRPTARGAVAECAAAGIHTVMITGDYPGTARHVAAEVGLASLDVVTGAAMDLMSDAELARRACVVDVFARVVPAQKVRLVHALQAGGAIVGMTGDGVNDAPALRDADVGVAMGARGSDVAREAADMVLVDDDFSSLVGAIRLGRRVYGNLRKAMTYVIAIHVAIAGVALLPVLTGWPLVLLPIHIVLLELIIDPASSIAFEAEPEEPDVMRRPPRDPAEPLFRLPTVVRAVFQGAVAFAMTAAALAFALAGGADEPRVRAVGFATIVLMNLGLVLASRSDAGAVAALRVRNPALVWVLAGAVIMLVAGLAVPALRGVLHFSPPATRDVVVVLAAAALALMAFDAVKWARGGGPMSGMRMLVVAALLAGTVARAAEPVSGELLYRRYCASCHGIDGRGDGPVAPVLTIPPTDLTRLEAGVPELMREIDGRSMRRAHGTAQMPVWGEVFEGAAIGEPHRRQTALRQVEALADYVRRLRTRGRDAR
ncbi:MAG TPA: HAD-IC family P-type ATPase [Candidatus Binatia bacterium]